MITNKGTAPARGLAGRLGRALVTLGLLGLASLSQALTLTVNSSADGAGGDCQGGGVCTLRQAVTEANAIPESSEALVTIAIPAGTYTLGATLVIERAMTLVGGGGDQDADPAATILQAGTTAGEAANGQLFRINPSYSNAFDTRFAALWLRHGYNNSNGYGGALDWDGSEDAAGNGAGTLTLYNTLFTDNVVDDPSGTGGAVAAFYGAEVRVERSTFRDNRVEHNGTPVGDSGAVSVSYTGTVTLDRVTIDGNRAGSAGGAGLYLIGTRAEVIASTLADNEAANGPGGGLVIADLNGEARLTNSTFSGNRAATNGGGLNLAPAAGASGLRLVHITVTGNTADGDSDGNGLGGGLNVANGNAPVTLYNTLVAGNRLGNDDASDVGGGLDGNSAHNLVGTGGAGSLADGVQGNQVGVAEPGLADLADNNGFTRTVALVNGSPALDAGDAGLPGANLATDQRGWRRAFAAASATPLATPDIGAYEAHPTLSLIADNEILGLLEGAPTRDLDFYVGDADQTPLLALSVSADDSTLLPASGLRLSGSGNARTLSLTPAAGEYGTTTVTLTATGYDDNGGVQESQQSQETFQFRVIPPPELTLTKTHAGDFHQGQTGATYTLTVGNQGPGATLGSTVTLTDTLPAGLSATALSGTGWNCDLATVRCTRDDVLATGAGYPPVTLTVDVASDAAASLTNQAVVSGGGDADGAGATDPTKILVATTTALATGGTSAYGETINLVATVSPGSATGDVSFERANGTGWDNLGTATLSGGTAVYSIPDGYGVGGYTFRARYPGDGDHYQSGPTSTGHTVTKADQTLTFSPPSTVTFGDSAFTLSATSDAGLTPGFASSNSDVIAVSGTTATIVGAGSVTLTASQAGNGNYNAATPVSRTVTVDPRPVTLTVTGTDRVYDGTPKAVTVTTTPAGVPVAVTYDGGATAPTDAGDYAVHVETDDGNYAGGTDVTLTIAKAGQTLTFPAPATRTVGDAPFALGGSASSGLTVSYASNAPGVVTVSGGTATIVGAGSATLTASQAGNDNYQAATDVARTLVVEKATQTITFPVPPSLTVGDPGFNLGASVDSGLTLSYASATPGVATVDSAGNVTPVGAGSTELTVSQAGDDDYQAASVSRTLTIAKQGQTLTFDAIADQDYPGSPIQVPLVASSDRSLPVTFRVDSGPASVAGDTLTVNGTGAITVVAEQAGNDEVEAATLTRSFQSRAADDATWTVGTCADGGEPDSLRAILAGAVDGNTVGFQSGLDCTGANAIRIADGGPLVIDQALDIDGQGADIEISGEGRVGVVNVAGTAGPVRVAGLTLRDGNADLGGGLNAENVSGVLTLEALSLIDNRATDRGGALNLGLVGAAAGAELTNLTLAANTADGQGGALAVMADSVVTVSATHLSLVGNSAPNGALADLRGPVVLELDNSVVAGDTDIASTPMPGAPTVEVNDSVVEGGYPGGIGIIDAEPLWTRQGDRYALLPGSPAIGAVPVGQCAATDQRGVTRTGRCDAGAWQSRGFTLALSGGDDQEALVDTDFDAPLAVTVSSAQDEPVTGGQVTFTGPASGAGLDGAPLTVAIDADGLASTSVTANGVVGEYVVDAEAAGAAAPLSFALENLPIGTDLTLAAATPATVNTDFDLTATLSADAALPSGAVDFQIEDNGAWSDLGSGALAGDTAVYTVSGGLAAGEYRFRARFPGNATHEASGWAQASAAVYPPLAVDDGGGAPLPGGDARTLTIQGGEGGDYQVDVRAPGGGLSSLTPSCGASACTVRFQAPDTGAFAGTYRVTVIDRQTGWQRVVDIVVPLSVSADRATLLSLDPLRRSAAVTVTGAGPGATVTLSPDAAAQSAGIQAGGPASAGDEADSGNPAGFTVTVPDGLVTALPVTLTAASPGLADGTLEVRAEPATVYRGVILDPLGAPLPGAEVVLLKETLARALLPPVEDENGERYRAGTDANGEFVLYAPPLPPGVAYWLEAMAPAYVAGRREAADCALSPCTLTLAAAEDVATPRFTPPAGAYPGGVTVTLESTTPGATLRYTLDGTTPSPSHGTEVANGTRLSLETDTTVKVIGYQAGLNVSEVASARYTITAVTVDSGGGAGGLAWWLLAPLLLWRTGGGRRAATLALAVLMLAPPLARAEGLFVGAELGQAHSRVDAGDINERLARRGQAGEARVGDRRRAAGRLYAGYQWGGRWEAQLGYTDLGELAVAYGNTGPVSAAALAAATPVAGQGLEASAGHRWVLNDAWTLGARLGLIHWRAELDVAGDERTRWGTGLVFGAALERRLTDHWDATLSWTRYRLVGEDTDLPALGLRYRFAAF
ncbi:Ig-like domain repeat protein [Alcanivorax sp. ZXX171]|nr:Ig-like domain repeat protein [Alcanivorax sp. ZXX171]